MRTAWPIALALGSTGCSFHEVLDVELPDLPEMRSVIVAIETEEAQPSLRVAALDLSPGEPPQLPALDAADGVPFVVSARFYRETLAELDITARGLLRAGEGGPLPARPADVDQRLRVVEGSEGAWADDGLGARAQGFRSPDLPPQGRCSEFETVASHPIGPDSAGTRAPIRDAARLGEDGLVLQEQNRLYRVNEDGVRDLSAELPDYERLFEGAIQSLTTWRDRVVVQRCAGGTPALVALAPDGTTAVVPTEGLSGCPRALDSFGDRLAALVGEEVLTLRAGEAAWRSTARFDGPIRPETFVAYAEEGFAALHYERDGRGLPLPPYTARVSDSRGDDASVLSVTPRTQFTIATPTAVEGRAIFAFSANLAEAEFYAGALGRPFELLARRGTNLLLGLTGFQGTVLATGFYGPLIQIDLARPSSPCADETVVASSMMDQLVDLGGGRVLIAGASNRNPTVPDEPRPEPQRLTIVRALPL